MRSVARRFARLRPSATGDRRGFALVAALWLLVALSVLGLELALRGRERRLEAANAQEGLRARAAAEAGLAHARAALARRLETAPQQSGGDVSLVLDPWQGLVGVVPDSQGVAGGWYRLELRDVGEALNLNRSDEDELRRLLVALRVDAGVADRIAQAAMDWRDPDDLHRPRGAERDDYLRRGALALPRNAPFASVDELRGVRGMTDEIFRRVSPHLTVLGTGQVNLATAPREVLLALPGMTEELAGLVERRRRRGFVAGSLADLGPELSEGARRVFLRDFPRLLARTTLETREVEVRARGWVAGGRVRARADGLMVRGGSAVFLVWRRVG